ncbi:MAG TPA: MFS transporter [Thermoleophilia bacterium]|nr:MFS transporter [Thermoleophilia bacterium]
MVFLSRLCVGPLSPFLKESFHLSNARISSSITGICVGAVAFAPTYGVMLLLLALSGLGCGFIYPSAVKAVMEWFPPWERGTAIGLNQSAVNVSGMSGAAIMPAPALAAGWQAGFIVAAAMAFAVCGLAAVFYKDADGRVGASTGGGVTAVCEIEQGLPCVPSDEGTNRAAVRPGFLAVLRPRDILLLGLAATFLCMVEFAALAHLVLHLKVGWVYSTVAAAGLLAVCQAAGAIGKPLSGFVSDRRLGRRRRPPLIAMALLVGLACGVRPSPPGPDGAALGGARHARHRRRGMGWPLRHAGRRDRRLGCRGRRHRRHRQHRHPSRPAALRPDRRPYRLLHAGLVDDGRRGPDRGGARGAHPRAARRGTWRERVGPGEREGRRAEWPAAPSSDGSACHGRAMPYAITAATSTMCFLRPSWASSTPIARPTNWLR